MPIEITRRVGIMKKKQLLALVLIFAMTLCMAACGKGDPPAKETVTVTFDTDGGDAIESQTIEKGSAVVKPATPKKAGYIFDKWTLNGNPYEFGTAVNENITLKAIWVDPNNSNSSSGSGEGSGSGSGSEESGSGGGSGSGGSSSSSEVQCEDLYWVNNWYWVQEKCYGDPEYVVKPESLKDKITFTSSDTSIATVDDKGMVYGVKPGNVTITMKCGDKKADLPLEVRAANGIYFSKEIVYLDYNSGQRSYASTDILNFKNDAQDKSITWTSSDPGRLYVDPSGLVMAFKTGLAVITATDVYGNTASYTVYAYGSSISVWVSGVEISVNGYTFEKGKTYDVSVTEETFTYEGLSKMVYISDIVSPSGSGYFIWAPSTEIYYGYLTVKETAPSQIHALCFTNPNDGVTTGTFAVRVK